MTTKTTNGVRVTVEPFFHKDYSNPIQREFMFGYRITLTNTNPFPVKLLGRYWHILDSAEGPREVEGEGVVGMQPVLGEGEEYEYVSGVNLHSELGRMKGAYRFENLKGRQLFEVGIPAFSLVYPPKLN